MEYNYEYVIEEIIKVIRDNLILRYCIDDQALVNIRKYCIKNNFETIDNYTIIAFVQEALYDLLNVEFLYDFRDVN